MSQIISVFQRRPTLNFITSTASTTDATSYSFPGISFGTAGRRRAIIVCAGMRYAGGTNDSAISAVTIGGISASGLVSTSNTQNGARNRSAVYGAFVPTGTSGTIAVTIDSPGSSRFGIAVYETHYLRSLTPVDTAIASNIAGFALPVDVPGNGLFFGTAYSDANAGHSWTVATEDADFPIGEANNVMSAASYQATTPETISPAVSFSTSVLIGLGVGVTLR